MSTFLKDHDRDIEEIARRFASIPYVTKDKVSMWLEQFAPQDQFIALKVLQHVRYYDTPKIVSACRELCSIAKQLCGDRLDDVRFLGLGSAGKSGGTMLHRFRQTNRMHTQAYGGKFAYVTEIPSLDENYTGSLVFIDDFIGSGKQASDFLDDVVTVAPEKATILLLVVAGFRNAMDEVGQATGCQVFAVDVLDESEMMFAEANCAFTSEEKSIIRKCCAETGARFPYGFDDVGALVVFAHGVPNNTISILTHDGDNWRALFPRDY